MAKDQPRRPSGQPEGGQWAGRVHGEADVELDTAVADTRWPALEWEKRSWSLEHRADLSRTQRKRHQGPYQAAVPLRIAGRGLALTDAIAAEAEDAAIAIARFDAFVSARLDAGDSVAELGPMDSVLLRTESASSSQIENITVGARQLALAELGEATEPNANLVAANAATMRAALALADRIDSKSILAMQHTLLARKDAENAGKWREQQIWIGGSAAGPHAAQFVPPHHDRVASAMDDLVAFIDREDMPALAQSAVAHAQFETIHPFTDGNGRTGRALLHAMLRSKGVTERVTVPISAGLLTDTEAYFKALGDYRAGDLGPIVQQVSEASIIAVSHGRELVDNLAQIRAGMSSKITARADAAAWRLRRLLLRYPIVNTTLVARELEVSEVTAQSAIDHMVAVGVLDPSDRRARNRVWQSADILDALDRFAAMTGRRRRAG